MSEFGGIAVPIGEDTKRPLPNVSSGLDEPEHQPATPLEARTIIMPVGSDTEGQVLAVQITSLGVDSSVVIENINELPPYFTLGSRGEVSDDGSKLGVGPVFNHPARLPDTIPQATDPETLVGLLQRGTLLPADLGKLTPVEGVSAADLLKGLTQAEREANNNGQPPLKVADLLESVSGAVFFSTDAPGHGRGNTLLGGARPGGTIVALSLTPEGAVQVEKIHPLDDGGTIRYIGSVAIQKKTDQAGEGTTVIISGPGVILDKRFPEGVHHLDVHTGLPPGITNLTPKTQLPPVTLDLDTVNKGRRALGLPLVATPKVNLASLTSLPPQPQNGHAQNNGSIGNPPLSGGEGTESGSADKVTQAGSAEEVPLFDAPERRPLWPTRR
ncbi:hypothetical protein IPL85_00545 [Candidatus Saccharibacteria bacterium]|nr:MAG: hypothetical protein IPL85_00545 [Candidatus Saccharibacteria bacterium]